MTAGVSTAPPRTAERGTCMACNRPYGRRRAPRGDSAAAALFDCVDLIACDQCWYLSGGARALQTALQHAARSPLPAAGPLPQPWQPRLEHDDQTAGEAVDEERGGEHVDATAGAAPVALLVPALQMPPALEQLLAAADQHDQLHPLDRALVTAGVRWSILRQIAVPARTRLAAEVLERIAPAGTCAAESAEAWLDAVDERIAAQTGTEFRYRTKRVRWRAIAAALGGGAHRDRRPLTWATQDELAAVVGCTARTVRRCVRWLREEHLLFEVVPGCRLPQAGAPDEETLTERATRQQRQAAAAAAKQAAIAAARARARAELDQIRPGAVPADVGDQLPLAEVVAPVQDSVAASSPALVNLTPVYELRVPAPPAPALPGVPTPRVPVTCTDTLPDVAITEFVHPPQVSTKDPNSNCVQTVDNCARPVDRAVPLGEKGRAPRGSDHEGADETIMNAGAGDDPCTAARPLSPQSRAVNVARWLLETSRNPALCPEARTAPPRLFEGVSLRWLAGVLRRSELLDRYEWAREDVRDLLLGDPEYIYLPTVIRNPRKWIRARLGRAQPSFPPSALRVIDRVERTSPLMLAQAETQAEQRITAAAAARRAAIHACQLCDSEGWLETPGLPDVKCAHAHGENGW